MSIAHQKLAKILRTDPQVLLNLETKLSGMTGKTGVVDQIMEENESLIRQHLAELGLTTESKAEEVYQGLIQKITRMDKCLFDFLGHPDLIRLANTCDKMCETVIQITDTRRGYFIKRERATKMLEEFPPTNLLEHFGYASVAELVEKQGLTSVFCSLRFAQPNEWMHEFFDKAYDNLTADDFEEREIEIKVLGSHWLDVAAKFMKKKYHNVSHLKELGVIFIVPIKLDIPGEMLRLFVLLLHYLNEVPFYSKLFRQFAQQANFPTNLKSLLRGDVPKGPAPENSTGQTFRIVQQYLAKDDEKDFRLFEPHVNPEAEHWYRAGFDLARLATLIGEGGQDFTGWEKMDFVGTFFHDGMAGQTEAEQLVSFDLTDLTMSLVKKGEIKYLYHQQEALWNKIFIEYFGRNKMNELIEQNIIGGFITT